MRKSKLWGDQLWPSRVARHPKNRCPKWFFWCGGSRWLEELLQWLGHSTDHYWTRIRNIRLFWVCRWDVTCRTVSLKGSLPSCSDLLPSRNPTNHCQTAVYPLSYPISPYNFKPVCIKSLIGNMMTTEVFPPEKLTCVNLNLSCHSHSDRKEESAVEREGLLICSRSTGPWKSLIGLLKVHVLLSYKLCSAAVLARTWLIEDVLLRTSFRLLLILFGREMVNWKFKGMGFEKWGYRLWGMPLGGIVVGQVAHWHPPRHPLNSLHG